MIAVSASAPASAMAPRRPEVFDEVLIDMRTCELTMAALMQRISELKDEYPEDEILMDGDAYAIVRRCRA